MWINNGILSWILIIGIIYVYNGFVGGICIVHSIYTYTYIYIHMYLYTIYIMGVNSICIFDLSSANGTMVFYGLYWHENMNDGILNCNNMGFNGITMRIICYNEFMYSGMM